MPLQGEMEHAILALRCLNSERSVELQRARPVEEVSDVHEVHVGLRARARRNVREAEAEVISAREPGGISGTAYFSSSYHEGHNASVHLLQICL